MSASDYIFPMTLPGVGLRLSREPTTAVTVHESVGGREMRSTWQTQPKIRYRLSIDFLRNNSSFDELFQVVRFFTARFGMLDSFLIDDPVDNTVTDKLESNTSHGFGVGDGATLSFQLQRTLKSSVYDKSGGPWAFRTTGRVNCAPRSRDFEIAPWAKTNLGALTLCSAPDGSYTASRYTSSGTATIIATSFTRPASVARTFSIFARCAAGTTLKIGTTEATSDSFTLSSSWRRIHVAYTSAGSTNTLTIGAAASWATGVTIELFQAQDEDTPTPASALYTEPDATSGAAVALKAPKFWPTPGDGFEPVYELKTSMPVLIYKGASLQTYGSDYTFSAPGLVLFAVAPAASDLLSWSGSFYRRVRFATPGISAERIVEGMWRMGGIDLVSVIP